MSEWISVKDKMPEGNRPVLYVVANSWAGKNAWVKDGMRTWDGNYWWWCDANGEYDEDGNVPNESFVTHWMPRPEPPK